MKRRNAARAAQVHTPMLFEEGRRDVAELSQWFTHPKTAEVLHLWARLKPGARVLEPSCGDGALIRLRLDLDWTAVDVDRSRGARLPEAVPFICADFLQLTINELGHFDAIMMNSPYEDGADLDHLTHALDFGTEVIALVKGDIDFTVGRWERLWKWVRSPAEKLTFIRRPDFGGEHGAMTDFVAWRLRGRSPREHTWRRSYPRGPSDPLEVKQVWV